MANEYEYTYEVDIVKKNAISPDGGHCWKITVANRDLCKNHPVQYDTSTGKALIFSNTPIEGLTLKRKKQWQKPTKSRLDNAEIEAMEVTE